MRLLPALIACTQVFVLTPLVVAQPFAPPPDLVSLRGQPPSALEARRRANGEALSRWQKTLTPEQRAQWFAAMGTTDPEKERRFGAQKIPDAGTGYDWATVARFAGLSATEVAQLGRDKLLLEDVSLRQSFEAYTMPRGPVFITSDSVLNAFHVLFEDSFREFELRRAYALRVQLESVVQKARELIAGKHNEFPVAELQSGWRHAQLVVGPALRLLGTPGDFFDANARDEIERQVALIRTAAAVELPAWLAPQSRALLAIDYRRCEPVGFYTSSASLQNYFRAVRWLQSVPFRAERDDELTAIALLGFATMRNIGRGTERFFASYHTFVGRPDDRALPEAAYDFQNILSRFRRSAKNWTEQLVYLRAWAARHEGISTDWQKIDDTLRLPPETEERLREIRYRVLSAARLPDAIVLARLAEPGRLPEGLAVAAMLGSEFAQQRLAHVAPERLGAALAEAREEWRPTQNRDRYRGPTLYERYLETLAALHAPAEPDAPAFMRGEAWAAKSCQTTLASWAQMRRTYTLQAKQSAHYLGLVDVPPGFVEPNPEFFRRLADLVEKAEQSLDEAEVFLPSADVEAERLREAAGLLESLGLHLPDASPQSLEAFDETQRQRYLAAVGVMDPDEPDMFALVTSPDASAAEFQQAHAELIASFRNHAADLSSGKRRPEATRSPERERWNALKSVTRRLEALAHKQLRRQPWTSDEERFIRGYGERLALVHGYFGNAWLVPRDDAPRWAAVARDPATDTQRAVGIGRPRLIHLLYPYAGEEVLCTGAVLSYYEYAEAGHSLTDEEWKRKLDSAAAPQMPTWVTPFLAR